VLTIQADDPHQKAVRLAYYRFGPDSVHRDATSTQSVCSIILPPTRSGQAAHSKVATGNHKLSYSIIMISIVDIFL
jgi:hypothetical protein